jgi:hypothetical protein
MKKIQIIPHKFKCKISNSSSEESLFPKLEYKYSTTNAIKLMHTEIPMTISKDSEDNNLKEI